MLEVLNHGRTVRTHLPIHKYQNAENIEAVLVDLFNASLDARHLENNQEFKKMRQEIHSVFPIVSELDTNESGVFITDIYVFNDDPSSVVFFDNDKQKVVKSVKLNKPVIGLFTTRFFNSFAQVIAVTSDKENFVSFTVIKLSKSNKDEVIVRKYVMDCGVEWRQYEGIIPAEALNLQNYAIKSAQTLAFDYWLEINGNKHILTDSNVGMRIVHILNHLNDEKAAVIVSQSRADFRRSKAVGDPGVLENNAFMLVSTLGYTVNTTRLLCKTSEATSCLLINNNKLFFINKKPGLSTTPKLWNPLCMMTFQMPGIVDFAFNNKKLLLVANDNQIYAYDNFDAFYSACYEDERVKLLATKQPAALFDAPVNYKGCIDDAVSFQMPSPSYVLNISEMFSDKQQVYMCNLFHSGAKEVLTFCTRGVDSKHLKNTFYVMSEGKIVFKESFKYGITSVQGVCSGYTASSIPRENSRHRDYKLGIFMMFTIETENGSMIRFEVDLQSKTTTNMPAVVNSGSNRFLDF